MLTSHSPEPVPATLPSAGKLIVLTGPSGVGKGTLVKALLARHPQLYLSVSATTRSPRMGEVNGKDYFFVDRDYFKQMIAREQLLEWAEYAGNYYGTPRAAVEEQVARGRRVLLEIELVGARIIGQTFPQACRIFILPPSVAELERRLRARAKDSEAAIAKRLRRAEAELAAAHEFDCQITNCDLETALQELEAAIFGGASRIGNPHPKSCSQTGRAASSSPALGEGAGGI
ncbi:MAG: guanylate kinase [Spirulinaceae cyanobacterium SM2_1_0]|nr:guanylate kinase [Spirulinaceae cyanobacterium SM2_1_0]